MRNFREILMEEGPNAGFSEYIASKIREPVNDPEPAEKLIPNDRGLRAHRVSVETRCYEALNLLTNDLIAHMRAHGSLGATPMWRAMTRCAQ